MFDVRLREFASSGTRGRVLPTVQFTTSIQESSAASLKFSVSEKVAGRVVAPFLVGVEFSTGGAYVQPRNGLFVVTEEGSDTADASETVEFAAVPFVPWLLQGMHQRMRAYPGSRYLWQTNEWPDVTPGRVLRSLIDYGKSADGWAPMLTVDFTATSDSAGLAWTSAERWSPEFRKLTSISDVLEAHVNAGLVDWWTEGTKLRLFRPGTGTIHPNVKLGGPGFQRMPVRRQFADQFNFLTIFAEDGARYYTNPGADETYGKRHATATLSGVKLADADRIVSPMLVEGRTPKRELSYEWTPTGKLPVPWVDFQVGDGVQARDRDGWAEQRVLGVTVSKSDAVTVRATVGAKLLNRLKRAVSKVEGGTLGDISGGTGVAVPAVPPVASAKPAVPGALRVESNTAVWLEDGTALTSVAFAWNEVAETADGALLDGATYELWSRAGAEASARLSATDALSFTVQGWPAGEARYVKVRALDRDGRPGAFSGEIAVTPVAPASIVPKAPTGLAVTSNEAAFQEDGTALATVTVGWDAVGLSTDDEPLTVTEYLVTAGLMTQRVSSPSATFTIPSGKSVGVTAQARTSLGVWGDPSAPLVVVGEAPDGAVAAPTSPILDTGMSSVTVRWDGMLTTGAPGPGLGFVYMDTAPDVAGPWTTLGTPLIRAGGATVRGQMDQEMWVRLRSTDTLGRPGGVSAAASIVVVGADGDDIVTGSIQVNHVSPSFGDQLNLEANGSINLLVGQVEANAESLIEQQLLLNAQEAELAAAQAAAQAAATGASEAGIAAAAAQAAADAAQAGVDQYGTVFAFEADGFSIASPGSPLSVKLTNQNIAIRRNGVAQTLWDETQMIVPRLKTSQVVVGPTVITEGVARTTWQRL